MRNAERSLPWQQAHFADPEHPVAVRFEGGGALNAGEGPRNGSGAGMDLPDSEHAEDDAAGKCHVDPASVGAMRKRGVGLGTEGLAANVTKAPQLGVGKRCGDEDEDGEELHVIQSSAGFWRAREWRLREARTRKAARNLDTAEIPIATRLTSIQ